MNIIKLGVVTFTFAFCSFSHKNGPRHKIIVKEYEGLSFRPSGKKNEQISRSLKKGFVKITLYDVKGRMHLEYFSKDSIIMETGNYLNSLDLLKKYSYATSPAGTFIYVTEYYEPLRNGIWRFYDSTGMFKDSIFYERGVKANSAMKKY